MSQTTPPAHEKVAVVVEPRRHRCAAHVLRQFDAVLRSGWHFVLFTGTTNDAWMAERARAEIRNHTWETRPIDGGGGGVANLTRETYSYLLTSEAFWLQVPGEHVLVFQMDTLPLPGSPFAPEDFFQYDYVGAPWTEAHGASGRVGNGGLSLRRRSSALVACRAAKPNTHATEDLYFARFFREHPEYRVPSADLAGRFSAETCMTHPHPFGVHYPGGLPEFPRLLHQFPTLALWLHLFQCAAMTNDDNDE